MFWFPPYKYLLNQEKKSKPDTITDSLRIAINLKISTVGLVATHFFKFFLLDVPIFCRRKIKSSATPPKCSNVLTFIPRQTSENSQDLQGVRACRDIKVHPLPGKTSCRQLILSAALVAPRTHNGSDHIMCSLLCHVRMTGGARDWSMCALPSYKHLFNMQKKKANLILIQTLCEWL